jgi:hydrogenase expression/formation protein HypC
MCQAIPRLVLKVDGSRAEVDYDGVATWVEAAGVADLHVGEYVVVYAGQALERMETAEAEEMLAWYASLESMLEEAEAEAAR